MEFRCGCGLVIQAQNWEPRYILLPGNKEEYHHEGVTRVNGIPLIGIAYEFGVFQGNHCSIVSYFFAYWWIVY